MNPTEGDPGWHISWRTTPWLLIPRVGLYRQLKRHQAGQLDGLVLMRQAFLAFSFSIAAFGIVLVALFSTTPNADTSPSAAIGLLIVAALAPVLGTRVERPLDCENDTALANSYRTRFFLRLAFAQSASLLGFVGFFVTNVWWTYPIGAAITAIGFRRAAPSVARLAAEQEALAARGCGLSLVKALRQPPPPTTAR